MKYVLVAGFVALLPILSGCSQIGSGPSGPEDFPDDPTAESLPPGAMGPPGASQTATGQSASSAMGFKPPHPDRQNLFSRPHVGGANGTVQGADVKVRGFVNVNGVRALLAVRGKAFMMEEGQEKAGVKVVKIEPPKVTLQSGQTKWTISLFDAKRSEMGEDPKQQPPADKSALRHRKTRRSGFSA